MVTLVLDTPCTLFRTSIETYVMHKVFNIYVCKNVIFENKIDNRIILYSSIKRQSHTNFFPFSKMINYSENDCLFFHLSCKPALTNKVPFGGFSEYDI